MTYSSLSAARVQLLESARPQPRKHKKHVRSHSMACYVPPGDGQASRRVTGSHLDPDSIEMEAAAVLFATGLHQTLQLGIGKTRSLIGPARYGDKVLAKYCQMLLKSALGLPSEHVEHPISPLLVPYLLGGIPWNTVEKLCHRALEVLDIPVEPFRKETLNKAVSNVGFGAHLPHRHLDSVLKYDCNNELVEMEVDKKFPHLSYRQDYLLNLPREAGYAQILIQNGAYDATLRRQLASWKPEMMAEVERLLDPAGGEMSAMFGANRSPVEGMNDVTFRRAVRRVFEQPWNQLDLIGGDQSTALADAEVLLARQIIRRISYNETMTAESLIGMSLLTGVSVANWTQFAIEDRDRRGESFLTAEELERAIEILEMMPHFNCGDMLNNHLIELRFEPEIMAGKRKWARRLQSAASPLWSTNGMYYLVKYDKDDLPVCKPKAFHAPKPEPKPANTEGTSLRLPPST